MSTYMYAVTDDPDLRVGGITGIGDTPVRDITAEGLTCVVSDVDPTEFSDARLSGDMPDLAWLERVARAHDAVVRAVAERATVVPLRLGLLCSDDAAVVGRLREVGGMVREVLQRVAGHDEWGVKIAATAARAPAPMAGAGGTGTSYLQQRRAALRERERSTAEAAADADAAYAELAARAVDSRRYPPQDARLAEMGGPMLLNAAFLVPRAERDAFRNAVAELADSHPTGAVTLTGPWPPYSFTSLDET